MKTRTEYRTYSVLVRNVGFLDIVACSYEAMLADVEQAYCNAEVITWTVR